jgi:nitrous oxidase accessory protein NosD
VDSSPAVVGGVVFVGSDDHKVYALNASNGAFIWNHLTGGSVFSSPAVAGGVVYVGSEDDKVYALNAATGAFIWSYTTGDWVLSSPGVADGKVYVGSWDWKVYCLDASTGAFIWSYTTIASTIDGSPAIVDGIVYIGGDDNNVYAFGPPTQSSTSVVCSPNPVSAGWSASCTATVSGSNPTGTITWSTSSITGIFGQPVCTLSSGSCSTTFTDNFSGSVAIAAYYSGDSNNFPSSGSTILTVTSSGSVYYSKNYTSVQAAIEAAPPGATLIIAPGFYSESLTVNKRLTIIGEKDPPIFSGGGSGICVLLLSGASGSIVTGIVITDFNEGVSIVNARDCGIYCNIFSFAGGTGIAVEGSAATNNAIFNNLFQDTPTPIKLTTSTVGNIVYGNIINSQATVTLNVGANGNKVYRNVISGNQIVLNMTNSQQNVIYHNNFLATAQITVLATGNNAWDDGYPSGGNYWSTYAGADENGGPNQNVPGADGIGDTPYVIATSSIDHYPLMKRWTTASGHSVAVISVMSAKRRVGQGFNCSVTVVVAVDGEYAETFNITCYGNDRALGRRQVSNLDATCPLTLTFTWNTAGFAKGNYTLSAYAWPVPGETNMADNNFTGSVISVTIPGDINGDFTVDIYDALLLAGVYNSNPSSPNWNANADINGDNTVDIYDALILAGNYGRTA